MLSTEIFDAGDKIVNRGFVEDALKLYHSNFYGDIL